MQMLSLKESKKISKEKTVSMEGGQEDQAKPLTPGQEPGSGEQHRRASKGAVDATPLILAQVRQRLGEVEVAKGKAEQRIEELESKTSELRSALIRAKKDCTINNDQKWPPLYWGLNEVRQLPAVSRQLAGIFRQLAGSSGQAANRKV